MERDNWKAAVAVSGKAGRECGSEFAERVLQMDTWTPSFRGVYVFTCVRVLGEAMRKRCECVADQAPKHYGSPAAFVPRMKAAMDSNPPADQRKIRRIFRACADDSPTR